MAATLDKEGREWLDQTPVEIPIPFTRPEPIRLRRIVERYHQEMQDANEYETFDDADDFEVGDNVPSYEDKPIPHAAQALHVDADGPHHHDSNNVAMFLKKAAIAMLLFPHQFMQPFPEK